LDREYKPEKHHAIWEKTHPEPPHCPHCATVPPVLEPVELDVVVEALVEVVPTVVVGGGVVVTTVDVVATVEDDAGGLDPTAGQTGGPG